MVGMKIRQVRESQNMLQKDLAIKAGLSSCHMSEIESGKKNASLNKLAAIAKALGVSMSALLDDGPADGKDDIDGAVVSEAS